jgi:hypothetical protein
VPADAYNVRSEAKADGRVEVTYRVHEPFPADGLLARIRGALPAPEWQPLQNDWLNPDNPSSHQVGWGAPFIDGRKSPAKRVHAWNAQWRDTHGNVVFMDSATIQPSRAQTRLALRTTTSCVSPPSGIRGRPPTD